MFNILCAIAYVKGVFRFSRKKRISKAVDLVVRWRFDYVFAQSKTQREKCTECKRRIQISCFFLNLQFLEKKSRLNVSSSFATLGGNPWLNVPTISVALFMYNCRSICLACLGLYSIRLTDLLRSEITAWNDQVFIVKCQWHKVI